MIRKNVAVIAVVLASLVLLPVQQAASSTITSIAPPLPLLERAEVSDLTILGQDGTLSTDLQAGSRVVIKNTITNAQASDQQFVHIVQVRDMDKVTVLLSWISGELAPEGSFDASRSWVPEAPGEYSVEVYVWDGIDSPRPLSPLLFITVTVDPNRPDANSITLSAVDEESRLPVAGAIVVIAKRGDGKIVFAKATDRNGGIEPVLLNGDYLITIQATGYNKITRTLHIDEDLQRTFELPQRCTGLYLKSCK